MKRFLLIAALVLAGSILFVTLREAQVLPAEAPLADTTEDAE
jgi:hypothetical protein